MSFKDPGKVTQVCKSEAVASFGDGEFFFFDQISRFIYPQVLIVMINTAAKNLSEQPVHFAFAHVGKVD